MDASTFGSLKVTALAGGVGGARLADGLAQLLAPENLTVLVNIGDDFDHLGLRICPDLDTVCYTLAGLGNPVTGWGRAGETWQALESLAQLGGPTWFRLGDQDLGLHLERTRRLRLGQPLSRVCQDFCHALGIGPRVLPASDDAVPTWVSTDEGELPFQEYFVHRQCRPMVSGFRFEGVEQARPAPGVLEALEQADIIVFCPSNPWVSIDPILAVPGVRAAIQRRRADGCAVTAVSPIIGGQTVKGPAAKMYRELGIEPSALAVARHFGPLLAGFVLDEQDRSQAKEIAAAGIRPQALDTWMRTPADRRRLAYQVLSFCQNF